MLDSTTNLRDGLPKGIHRIRALPDPQLALLWDSIHVGAGQKEQLLSQAVLNFTVRAQVPRTVLPLHGVILLVGPPGTGKTSLALGLADRVARSFKSNGFRLVEVDPHQLANSALGKTVVLLDEVETLAVDRSRLSMDANPIDVHRATDAVLVQLDLLAESNPNLLFVATSNFPQALDEAFTSRCDLVIESHCRTSRAADASLVTACWASAKPTRRSASS